MIAENKASATKRLDNVSVTYCLRMRDMHYKEKCRRTVILIVDMLCGSSLERRLGLAFG